MEEGDDGPPTSTSAFLPYRPPTAPDPSDLSGEWNGGRRGGRRFAPHRLILRCTAGLRALQERRLESRTPDSRSNYSTGDGSIDAKQLLPLLASRYRVKGVVGEGTSAKILLAEDVYSKSGNRKVAIKVFRKSYYAAGLYEASVLRYLNYLDPEDCCSCVRVYDCFTFAGHACVVMEKLQGTLIDLMVKLSGMRKRKRAGVVRKVAAQVLALLALMHSRGLVHSDLKPENILVESYFDAEEAEEAAVKVKVVDFGNCFPVPDGKDKGGCSGTIQTLPYRAPEVFQGREARSSVDMWSLGCILAEVSLLSPLFPGDSEEAVYRKIENLLSLRPGRQAGAAGMMPEHHIAKRSTAFFQLYDNLAKTDVQLADFVDRLLKMDPETRLGAKFAFGHSFLQPLFSFRTTFDSGLGRPGARSPREPATVLPSGAAPTEGCDAPGGRGHQPPFPDRAEDHNASGDAFSCKKSANLLAKASEDDTGIKVFDLLRGGEGDGNLASPVDDWSDEDEDEDLEFANRGNRNRNREQVLDSPRAKRQRRGVEGGDAPPQAASRRARGRRTRTGSGKEWWKA